LPFNKQRVIHIYVIYANMINRSMVVGFTICYQCLSPLMLWVLIPLLRGVLDITLCDQVCQGQWLPLTSISFSNAGKQYDKIIKDKINWNMLTDVWGRPPSIQK
jgi:hypothetical protein